MDADQSNMDVPTCPGCVAAAKRIAELEARIALLEQKLEASLRSGKRQAAPFSRGLPKVDPKRPGRKSGDDYGTKAFPAVVNRKVWGGNRTEAGAAAQSTRMTVLFTAAKLKQDGMQFVRRVLCSPPGHQPKLSSTQAADKLGLGR
ncbi:MAG TPA: hypothetical protein VL992_20180 [Tepidisphaeraceae bacterium]|nr:hypothetical protein [Tepidisphaeraceae bacterium]